MKKGFRHGTDTCTCKTKPNLGLKLFIARYNNMKCVYVSEIMSGGDRERKLQATLEKLRMDQIGQSTRILLPNKCGLCECYNKSWIRCCIANRYISGKDMRLR